MLDLRALERLRGRHNQQNAAVAYAAVRALGLLARAGRSRLPELRGPAAPHGGGGAGGPGSGSSTTARRPTPIAAATSLLEPSTRSSGSPAASPSPAASRACAPQLRATSARPILIGDGGGRDRGATSATSRRSQRSARWPQPSRPPRVRREPAGSAESRRAAGPGLRVLRPVRELRGARRPLPRSSPARVPPEPPHDRPSRAPTARSSAPGGGRSTGCCWPASSC